MAAFSSRRGMGGLFASILPGNGCDENSVFYKYHMDVSNPIVLMRTATETGCENSPVQSPLPGLFSFAESSKNRMVHDKNQLFYRMIKVRYSMVRKNIPNGMKESMNTTRF